MATRQNSMVLRSIRTLFEVGAPGGLTDAQLLERFLSGRTEVAEAAFEAMVNRHGPMVLGVCRRTLRDAHAAEDAFQATFLVFAMRAGSIRRRDSLASWLFGVARKVASRSKTGAARRRAHEQAAAVAETEPRAWGEQEDFAVLFEEVDRLPKSYREPIILCYVEGMTYEAAAEQLRCPLGTLSVRLMRARERLRSRLTRRGLVVPAGLLVGGIIPKATSGAVASGLVELAVRTAMRRVVSRATVSVTVPASVALMAKRVNSAMRYKTICGSLFGVGMIVLVATASVAMIDELRAQAVPERVTREQAPSTWVKTLPRGAMVELVGVSSFPAGPGTWWVPDGLPLSKVPYVKDGVRLNFANDRQARGFAVRVKHPPEEGVSYRWQIPAAGSTAGGTPRDAGDKVVPDLSMIAVSVAGDLATCEVRFGVACGPWNTVAASGPDGGEAHGVANLGLIFGNARESGGKIVLSVSHDDFTEDIRVVAVDRADKEHTPSGYQSLGVRNHNQLELEFDLPRSEVKGFRFQTRPFEWATFENVALKPQGK
jgi:RNA polymerase sigma factor (sigma-70 family)